MTKPIILFESKYTSKDVSELKKQPIFQFSDLYLTQSKEVFEISHPSLKSSANYEGELNKFIQERKKQNELAGNWLYFPWSGTLLHAVNKEEYFALRTNRNKNLITAEEQEILCNFCTGMIGLSVGGAIAANLAYLGISETMKLAEFDTLDTTNLNRVRAKISDISRPKIDLAAEQIYEINPYANLILFPQGIKQESIAQFIEEEPRPKLIFEMIDNFEMKVCLRLAAREEKIPVIMFANLGDNILLDIERYDLDNTLPLFNGKTGNIPEEILKNPDVTDEDKHKYAIELVGREYIPQRALDSVKEIGKTLVGRPQLASTVTISGGIAAYLARKIALGETVPSGRYFIDFEKAFLGKRQ